MNIQRPVTALSLRLPSAGGKLERFDMSAPRNFPERVAGPLNRIALAAAHVVVDPLAEVDPWLAGRRPIGSAPSPSASTSGTSASASPRRWTRRSAAWGSTGRWRSS